VAVAVIDQQQRQQDKQQPRVEKATEAYGNGVCDRSHDAGGDVDGKLGGGVR
jgi:hypothetical protein